MTNILYLSLRVGFLILLWVFIFSILIIMRSDLRIANNKPAKSLSQRKGNSASSLGASTSSRNSNSPSVIKIITENGDTSTVPLVSSPFTLGRSETADITLTDNFASGKHARFYYNNGCWFIEDTGSTNGTFINKERLTAPVQVGIGSKINIGKTTLEII